MTSPASLDVQRLCGLTIAADFALHQDRPSAAGIDITVSLGETIPRNDSIPPGQVLLDFEEPRDHWYSLVRNSDGSYLFRVYTMCDFRITADLSGAVLQMVDGADRGMASVMTVGTFVALQLYLRRHLVLHASAVEIGGRALAIMGHSGMGKSTLAALLCADGARLVADDVLGVPAGDRPRVAPGATEVRLRPGTGLLGERLDGADHRISADSREVVRLPSSPNDDLPLAAVLIPWPNRDDRLELERLPGASAVLELLRYPRLLGWRDEDVIRTSFAEAAKSVAQVPVFRAHVPWGPPFRHDIGDAVRDAVFSAAARV